MSVAPVSKIKPSSRVDPSEQVERLRTLLLGPESDQVIQRLVEKDQTTLVMEVISEALEQRANKDDSLAQSLSSVVDAAIDTSIKEHPDPSSGTGPERWRLSAEPFGRSSMRSISAPACWARSAASA